MKTTKIITTLAIISVVVLGGCASNSPQQTSVPYSSSQSDYNYGVIDSIQNVHANTETSGAGAVVGGLVGGLLGSQVGDGRGKTAATVVGAVGGAVVGNSVEKNRKSQDADRQLIRIRLNNGNIANIEQEMNYDLSVGNRVRVADGHAYRY